MITKHTFRENVLRIVAVVGLIAVLLLGAWGIIQLAFFIPTFLSNLAQGGTVATQSAEESISLSVPASVTAEQAFLVSWTHKNFSSQYSYALSYSCQDGLSAKAPLPNGTAQIVACNTPFNYLNATNTTPLIFTLAGSKPEAVTVTVFATKLNTGAVTVSGTASTTVAPATTVVPTTVKQETPAKITKPAATKYVASVKPRAALFGYPDLAVRIMSAPTNVRAGQQINLQFVIENLGTNVAPANWFFTADLPYSPSFNNTYTYQSPTQQALYPGDKIVYTLGYAAQYQQSVYGYTNQAQNYGQSSTIINVDPYNLVLEINEYNNSTIVSYQVF